MHSESALELHLKKKDYLGTQIGFGVLFNKGSMIQMQLSDKFAEIRIQVLFSDYAILKQLPYRRS